jgi:hypothetical protein
MVYVLVVGPVMEMDIAMEEVMEMDVGVSGESPVEGWEMGVAQGCGRALAGV